MGRIKCAKIQFYPASIPEYFCCSKLFKIYKTKRTFTPSMQNVIDDELRRQWQHGVCVDPQSHKTLTQMCHVTLLTPCSLATDMTWSVFLGTWHCMDTTGQHWLVWRVIHTLDCDTKFVLMKNKLNNLWICAVASHWRCDVVLLWKRYYHWRWENKQWLHWCRCTGTSASAFEWTSLRKISTRPSITSF